MDGFKSALDAFAAFVLFPIALLLLVDIAIAVGVQALLIYVGALLAAWLFTAFGFPLVTGAMTLDEIADGFRSRRRSERLYKGEPLPDAAPVFPYVRRARKPRKVLVDFRSQPRNTRRDEGEPLPDWLLGFPFSKTFDAKAK
jgi:hypothetical protein